VGMADRAKREAAHLLNTLAPAIARGVPIIGLEPSCLYALRDELPALIPGAAALAKKVVHFAEWIAARPGKLAFREANEDVLLHGHCHEKAFDAMGAVQRALALVPGLKVSTVETSCCGMAGSFGYEAEHAEVSMRMAEMTLLPAIRKAPGAMLVADGTSCRHQILDGTGRKPLHIARVLEAALSAP